MSRSRHSSSECLGGSKTWSVSSSLSWPVKSSIGEMSRSTSATPSSRNQRNESVCTSMRFGRSLTSRSFEKDRRSRDARRANVTPIRRRSRCGIAQCCEPVATVRGVDARRTGRSGARRQRAKKIGEARAGRHGYAEHSARHAGCQRCQTDLLATVPVAARIRPDPAGWQPPAPRFSGRRPADRACRPGYLSSTVGAGLLELGLGLLGVFLRRLLEHRLRGAVDEVLGLLEAEARELADRP